MGEHRNTEGRDVYKRYRGGDCRRELAVFGGLRGKSTPRAIGLYTVLPSPIVYGVWHTEEGVGGRVHIAQRSCNIIAIG